MQSNDLIDFIESASQQIADEYKRIQKRVKEDPGTAGDQGEENWATVLKNWLPHTFHVVTKGRILNNQGVASPQVDIIVLRPEYPPHLLDKKLFLAGGVLAIFECKVTLKAKHIEEFIKNSIELKNQIGSRKGTPYKELQSPVIYVLLAHSHSWKSKSSEPAKIIENKLIEIDRSYITHPLQMPDIICVDDVACWISSKVAFISPRQIPGSIKNSVISHYIGFTKELPNQTESLFPVGSMIALLLNKLAWEYPSLRHISEYFTQTNIQGNGLGSRDATRNWNTNIYSDETRLKLESGKIKNGEPWDEWSLVIS